MEKKQTNAELVDALREALQDESVLDALSGSIVDRLVDLGIAARLSPQQAWRTALGKSGLACSDDLTPERASELFRLSTDEIGRVLDRARTDKAETPLNLERLRELVIAQLGDDQLMMRSAQPERASAGRKKCTGEYECGYTYHCGHEVNCGTAYELLPCGNLYDYACGPDKSCAKPYLCGVKYL